MSDILSASSLFLAALGLLYSTWYVTICAARDFELSAKRLDRTAEIKQLKQVRAGRAVPLALAACAAAAVLLPPFLGVLWECMSTWLTDGLGALGHYDPVKALFAVVYLLTLGLAIHTFGLAVHLSAKVQKAQSDGA